MPQKSVLNQPGAFCAEIHDVFVEGALIHMLYELFEVLNCCKPPADGFQDAKELIRQANLVVEFCRPHHEALALLERAVSLGDGEACGRLGWALLYGEVGSFFVTSFVVHVGHGCSVDLRRGFELAQRGSEVLGDLTAMAVLAYCYYWGRGCVQDRELATQLASSSASQDNVWGIFILGCTYYWAEGLGKDYSAAFGLYQKVR